MDQGPDMSPSYDSVAEIGGQGDKGYKDSIFLGHLNIFIRSSSETKQQMGPKCPLL